jgi:iron(III) transport system substrate-binding protein
MKGALAIGSRRYVLLLLVLLVLALPFVFRGLTLPTQPAVTRSAPADQLVIMTPHLEAVRRKFERAFSDWYAREYHRAVSIEYLSYGGGEIVKYFQASEAAFRRTGTYNIDIVWGGSDSMFNDVLEGKYLEKVPLDPAFVRAAFPDPDIGGVPLYDPDASNGPRWFGAALSSFGILYNRDLLAHLGLPEPKTWSDLADPRYRGWVELADPTRSASAKAALMVIVEREMETASRENSSQEGATHASHGLVREDNPGPTVSRRMPAQAEAWAKGMGLIRQIAANARGFTSAANELPGLVSNGDAAAAMAIDFYARAQIAAVGECDDEQANACAGAGRVGYVEPQGATIVTPEPIAMARGAQHAETARRFIEFILSDAGQRLWITKAGPGETPEMALQRLPIVRSVYDNPVNFSEFTNPYTTAGGFNTKPSRRATFGLMDELIVLCCIDLLSDLRETRKEIIESPRGSELDARLGTFPIDQAASRAGVDVHGRMLKGKPEDWLTLQRRWREEFREEYRELRRAAAASHGLAREGNPGPTVSRRMPAQTVGR